MTPELTIIVPVFNTAAFLRESLDSCMKQTFQCWECILVDDGSTDGSAELCQEYTLKDARFRLIRNQHRGVAVARNTGLELVRGEFVSFLDSDDRLRPEMFQHMIEAQRISGAEIIICSFYAFERENAPTYYPDFHRATPRNRVFGNREIALPFLFDAGPWSKLFRRDFLTKNHLRFIAGIQFEDIPFWCAAVKCHPRYYYLPEQLYEYRQKRNGSTIASGTVKDLDFSFYATLRTVEALGRNDMLDAFAGHMPLRALKAAAVAPRGEWDRFCCGCRALFRGFCRRHRYRKRGTNSKRQAAHAALRLWGTYPAWIIQLVAWTLFWLRNDRIVRFLKQKRSFHE